MLWVDYLKMNLLYLQRVQVYSTDFLVLHAALLLLQLDERIVKSINTYNLLRE